MWACSCARWCTSCTTRAQLQNETKAHENPSMRSKDIGHLVNLCDKCVKYFHRNRNRQNVIVQHKSRQFPVVFLRVPGVHFYIGQQGTQNADITSAITRQAPVFTKRTRKATAVRTAPTALLHTDHTTCAALFMTSGTTESTTGMCS